MKFSKFLVSTAAAAAVVSSIGLAYAQTDTPPTAPPATGSESDSSSGLSGAIERNGLNEPIQRAPAATPATAQPYTAPAAPMPSNAAPAAPATPAAPAVMAPNTANPAAVAPNTMPNDTSSAGSMQGTPVQPTTPPAADSSMTTEPAPQADRN